MDRIPLVYTFGNHMHWVDMQWLWGYHVLPGSIRDMLSFCRETGARGNVNFDGIGYEKLAAEDPEALAELKDAVQDGMIEPVGCSYGQPYGLFHGGESNIRQRIYGARAVRRLLGVWPKTFWEEEFDFFPQLPQILKGCGFEYASLFFQWTWHTPEVPKEVVPVVWWEGQDGSQLLCATRNKLNLHQWPEDMDATFAELAANPPDVGSGPTPLILQWLELMPSPDWMCRSELLLPKMRQLIADERFEIKMATLGEYLRSSIGILPMGTEGFQPSGELSIRHGARLPHWTRDGATYHVVFRLFDSVPASVQEEWTEERKRLEGLVSRGHLSAKEKFEYQRLLAEKIENYLDSGKGSCLLKSPEAGQIVADALEHFNGERYVLSAYCVMPNHVHVVLRPLTSDLPAILHSWKSFTANKLNEVLGRTGEVWQREYYDHIVRNPESFAKIVKYVCENPAKAGLLDWKWVKDFSETRGQDAPDTHRQDADDTPVRKYTMDQVWHGMSLGKNGDHAIHRSHSAERSLLSAESLQAILGLFGRPYENWDVFPTWEMEEGWRNLLAAQHHDNHECEGLCGHVAWPQFEAAETITVGGERGIEHLCSLVAAEGVVAFNPFGWERTTTVQGPGGVALATLPPLGYAVIPESAFSNEHGRWQVEGEGLIYERDGFHVQVNLAGDRVITMRTRSGQQRRFQLPLVQWKSGGTVYDSASIYRKHLDDVFFMAGPDGDVGYWLSVPLHHDALDVTVSFEPFEERVCDPGLNSGARTIWLAKPGSKLVTDQPYGVSEANPQGTWLRKYPEGDWMTSAQWFESVENSFFSQSFVELADSSGSRLLILHNGSQQWQRIGQEVHNIIQVVDPWDGGKHRTTARAKYRVFADEQFSNAKKWKLGREFFGLTEHTEDRPVSQVSAGKESGGLPSSFSALSCDAPNVVPTAFYRETEDFSGKYLDDYAGKGMGYPFVVRLVEFDGIETETTLNVSGTVARAYRTNLLGQIQEDITHDLKVHMGPYEIATVYLDIIEGRKQTRDLDAKREVWATVHRVED